VHHTILCDVNERVKNTRIPQTFKRHYAVCMHARARACVRACMCAITCVFHVCKYKFFTKTVRKHNADLGPRNRIQERALVDMELHT
jgi:hypothetical protein